MLERYGFAVREARRWLRSHDARTARAPQQPRGEAGRVKGLFMRPEIEGALMAIGEYEGGQGRALAHAMAVYAALVICTVQTRNYQIVVDLARLEVRPLEAMPKRRRPTLRERCEAAGQVAMWVEAA